MRVSLQPFFSRSVVVIRMLPTKEWLSNSNQLQFSLFCAIDVISTIHITTTVSTLNRNVSIANFTTLALGYYSPFEIIQQLGFVSVFDGFSIAIRTFLSGCAAVLTKLNSINARIMWVIEYNLGHSGIVCKK